MSEKTQSSDGIEYTQCPTRGVPYLIGDDSKNAKRKIFKARCKLWSCPYCAEINKSIHYNRIVSNLHKYMSDGYEFDFVTITCHESWRGWDASSTNWFRNKDKLFARYRREIARQGNYTPEYVYIPETHSDSSIHIHGLFTGKIRTKWWKDNARASGLGYQCKSIPIKNVAQGVFYCLKYIQKEMGKANPSKGFRRINYSRGFTDNRKNNTQLEFRMVEKTESLKEVILEGLRLNYETALEGLNYTFDDFL